MKKKNRGLLATLAGDMLETLREDLAGVAKIDGMKPFTEAVAKELPEKRRRRATAAEKQNASVDDVAGAAKTAFGGIVRALNGLAATAAKVNAKRPSKTKRKLGPS